MEYRIENVGESSTGKGYTDDNQQRGKQTIADEDVDAWTFKMKLSVS